MTFRPKEILKVLADHDVSYVLIGGVAASAHGSPYPTTDLDICPEDDDENLMRLAAALEELEAKLLVTDEPEPIQVFLNPRILRASDFLNFQTKWGTLDIVWRPAATRGYEDLRRQAERVPIGGVEVDIAALGDIVRSKSALLRDKDLKTLHVLRELAEQQIADEKGSASEGSES